MYVINDIELLMRLSQPKILDCLTARCTVAVSGIRLSNYSLYVKRFIESKSEIVVLQIMDDAFDEWVTDKRRNLSIGDLSSIYIALCNEEATLVLSQEDQFLAQELEKSQMPYLSFDKFVINQIQDQRIIKLYNDIKIA